jgi:hypothetical protein
VIGDRDQADDHRAHLAQNQAFEGDCFSHFSRLLDRPTPDFLALSWWVEARIFGVLLTGPLLADQKYLADGEAFFGKDG